ncbi:MAG: hypothetical protein AAF512_20175, partial [Pseudomonadota bacterium]
NPAVKIGCLTASPYPKPARRPIWHDGLDLADYPSIPDAVADFGGDFWDVMVDDLTETDLQRAHELGLEVSVWGLSRHVLFEQARDWGVDYITTIYPDRFVDK